MRARGWRGGGNWGCLYCWPPPYPSRARSSCAVVLFIVLVFHFSDCCCRRGENARARLDGERLSARTDHRLLALCHASDYTRSGKERRDDPMLNGIKRARSIHACAYVCFLFVYEHGSVPHFHNRRNTQKKIPPARLQTAFGIRLLPLAPTKRSGGHVFFSVYSPKCRISFPTPHARREPSESRISTATYSNRVLLQKNVCLPLGRVDPPPSPPLPIYLGVPVPG